MEEHEDQLALRQRYFTRQDTLLEIIAHLYIQKSILKDGDPANYPVTSDASDANVTTDANPAGECDAEIIATPPYSAALALLPLPAQCHSPATSVISDRSDRSDRNVINATNGDPQIVSQQHKCHSYRCECDFHAQNTANSRSKPASFLKLLSVSDATDATDAKNDITHPYPMTLPGLFVLCVGGLTPALSTGWRGSKRVRPRQLKRVPPTLGY